MRICRGTTLGCCALIVALFAPLLRAEPASQWMEVRSPHFSVITDGGEKRGREVALRFEQMRAVFSTVLPQRRTSASVPLQIIAFRSNRDLRAYAPLWQGKPIELVGFFAPGHERQFIALDLSASSELAWRAVFHEYAHQLLHESMPGVQLWFDEGFAEYYSTIRFTRKGAEIGLPPDAAVSALSSEWMPLEQLFSVGHHDPAYNEAGDRRRLFYAQSWLLIHYLMDMDQLRQAEQYLTLTGSGVATADAIRQAFGMNSRELETALATYLHSGQSAFRRLPLPADLDKLQLTSAPLSDADARTVLADLHLHSPDYIDQAIAEYRSILKDYPKHTAAHRGLGYALLHRREFEQAGSEFRAAARDSSDPGVYYYSALLAVQQGRVPPEDLEEVSQQIAKAITLNPDFADAYSVLGWTQMTKGETQAAIQSLRRAVTLNPRNETYRFNLARCLLADAQYDGAEALLAGLMASKDAGIARAARTDLEKLNRLRKQQKLANRPSAATGADLK